MTALVPWSIPWANGSATTESIGLRVIDHVSEVPERTDRDGEL